jgi:hypothetical protein
LIAALSSSALLACTQYLPYRPILGAAPVDCTPRADRTVAEPCRNRTPEHSGRYDLHVVEFDDQGWLHPPEEENSGEAARQIDSLMDALREAAKGDAGVSIVVYVHGWKHNADADDENIKEFRDLLLAASLVEESNEEQARIKRITDIKARRVVGVYVGWRGKSLDLPEPFINVTFWDRKFTAQHVAQGSVRELFSRLRGFQHYANRKSGGCEKSMHRCPVRMLMIGHSFGALVLFNAISEALVDSLAVDYDDQAGDAAVQRFGDLVILVNPAFEASRYETLHRVATRRESRKYQAPIFVSVTSRADWATRFAFPFGRFFNTFFERTSSDDERVANNNTIGHIPRYITHHLAKDPDPNRWCPQWVDPASDKFTALPPAERIRQLKLNLEVEQRNDARFLDENLQGGLLRDHWSRAYCGGALLKQTQYDANSPIWNIETDKEIIAGHNEITASVFTNFIRQLYHETVVYPF